MLENFQNLQIAINSVMGVNVTDKQAKSILDVWDHLKDKGNSVTIQSIKTLSK